jgi:allophanate hydrolase subunit 1
LHASDRYRAWFATLVNISTSEVMEVVQAMLDLYASLDAYDQSVHAAAALDAVAQECNRLNEVDGGGAPTPTAVDGAPWGGSSGPALPLL